MPTMGRARTSAHHSHGELLQHCVTVLQQAAVVTQLNMPENRIQWHQKLLFKTWSYTLYLQDKKKNIKS